MQEISYEASLGRTQGWRCLSWDGSTGEVEKEVHVGHSLEEKLTGRVKEGLREVDEGKSGVRVDSSIFGTTGA